MKLKILTRNELDKIISLGCELNPAIAESVIGGRLAEMFDYSNYRCFGMFLNDELAGIASGWVTTRLYSGKQLEIDNVIITSKHQSRGYGKEFLSSIENWAVEQGCMTVELNTYVTNERSHKFYFNRGYKILGFHFQKILNA